MLVYDIYIPLSTMCCEKITYVIGGKIYTQKGCERAWVTKVRGQVREHVIKFIQRLSFWTYCHKGFRDVIIIG